MKPDAVGEPGRERQSPESATGGTKKACFGTGIQGQRTEVLATMKKRGAANVLAAGVIVVA